MRKSIAVIVLLFCLLLCGCAGSNEYELTYTADGDSDIEYIYYDDIRVVYVVGGLMMAEVEGSPK
ncbi:MAG: hypothetical protein IKZ05_05765, partial [Clostridia bacterium]|nr:hypothetical protein [Clostridia bacterium]